MCLSGKALSVQLEVSVIYHLDPLRSMWCFLRTVGDSFPPSLLTVRLVAKRASSRLSFHSSSVSSTLFADAYAAKSVESNTPIISKKLSSRAQQIGGRAGAEV